MQGFQKVGGVWLRAMASSATAEAAAQVPVALQGYLARKNPPPPRTLQ